MRGGVPASVPARQAQFRRRDRVPPIGPDAPAGGLRTRGLRTPAVYNRAMGLFRRRDRKKREKAAAELQKEQATPAKAQAEAARREVTAEARPAKAQAEAARREVTAEARPDPDQPGWGRTIGQEIAKAREGDVTRP
jgi:hypothetical protein